MVFILCNFIFTEAMLLKEGEKIVKVFRHHGTTLFYRELKVLIASLPFYFVGFLVAPLLSFSQGLFVFISISLVFGILITGDGLLYYMDRLVITNRRILYIEWHSLLSRKEYEADLNDIQDIETQETGLISSLKLFDYGLFRLQTASARTTIVFTNAPDPEGIKHFVYQLNQKHNRIHAGIINRGADDQANTTYGTEVGSRASEAVNIPAER